MNVCDKAVILAAGQGLRLHPASLSLPKELLPICGQPIIQFVIDELHNYGVRSIGIVISKEHEAIARYLVDAGLSTGICFIYQPEATGEAQALAEAYHFAGDDPFVLAFGDTIVQRTQIARLDEEYRGFGNNPSVLLYYSKDQRDHRRGYVVSTVMPRANYDAHLLTELGPVSTNVSLGSRFIFGPEIFDYLDGNENINDTVQDLMSRRDVYGIIANGFYNDIDTYADYVNAILQYITSDEKLKRQTQHAIIKANALL